MFEKEKKKSEERIIQGQWKEKPKKERESKENEKKGRDQGYKKLVKNDIKE